MYLYINYYISTRIWCQYWCQWCQMLSRHQIFQKYSVRSVLSIVIRKLFIQIGTQFCFPNVIMINYFFSRPYNRSISFDAAQIPVLYGAASAHQKFKLLGFLRKVLTLHRFPAQTGERRGIVPTAPSIMGNSRLWARGFRGISSLSFGIPRSPCHSLYLPLFLVAGWGQ